MIDYEGTKRAWRRNKAALTRAKKTGDPVKVLAVTQQALRDFQEYGWPDGWAVFSVAQSDALNRISHF